MLPGKELKKRSSSISSGWVQSSIAATGTPRGNALSTNSRGHVHHPLCTGHPQRVQHAAPGGASDVSTSSWDSVSIPDGGSDSSFLVVDPWEPISLPQRPRGFESLVNMEELNHSIPCEFSSVVSDSSWIDVLESEEHKD